MQQGFEKVKLVEKQMIPDGNFSTVESPNPEDEQSFEMALSEASKVSLKLQGGVMNDSEAKKFISFRFHDKAILLRKYDDEGKIPNIKMKKIEDYRDLIKSQLIRYTI